MLPLLGNAQSFGPHFDPSVPFRDSTGNAFSNPWTGGLNFCQFSELDVDRDGSKDLFVFDRSGNKIEVFLSKNGRWVHREAYDDRFPALSDWVLFRDMNADGNMDLFTSTSGGIALYKNDGTTPLSFTQVSQQLLSDHYPEDPSTDPINIYVQNMDVPAIDDIDGDGDPDILNFHILGEQVEYHRNITLEQNGVQDTLIFERRNACWGFFSEGGSSSSITLDDSCSGNVQNPEGTGRGTEGVQRHSGSTLLTFDGNGDGVKELLLGDIGSDRMKLLENGGGPSSSHMVNVESNFPTNDVSVDLSIFPAAFYLDVDRDGTKDLLVSPNKGVTSENRKSIWFYKNLGSDTVPDFELQKRNFLQDSTFDQGEGAYPTFCDIDGDGDQDLFVGNQDLHDQGGEQASSIAFIENIGSPSSPSFQLRNSDFASFSQAGMGQALHPAFGDLDGDGDLDLMIGDSDGYLHYFENSSPVGDQASFTLMQPQYDDDQGQTIDVGQFAAPTLIDLDRDGLLDLVIGEKGGNLVHYENIGSASSPSYRHRTDSLGDVMVTEPNGFEGYSVPRFFEDSGSYELIVGSKSGRLHYYKDIEGNLSGSFQRVSDRFGGIDDGKRSAPAIAELNGDQRPEIVLGDHGGGLSFYRGGDPVTSMPRADEEAISLQLHPNPVRSYGRLIVEGEDLGRRELQPRIYDLHGRTVKPQRVRKKEDRLIISFSGIEPGLYFIRIQGASDARPFIVR